MYSQHMKHVIGSARQRGALCAAVQADREPQPPAGVQHVPAAEKGLQVEAGCQAAEIAAETHPLY